jgi:hypothetical protein
MAATTISTAAVSAVHRPDRSVPSVASAAAIAQSPAVQVTGPKKPWRRPLFAAYQEKNSTGDAERHQGRRTSPSVSMVPA